MTSIVHDDRIERFLVVSNEKDGWCRRVLVRNKASNSHNPRIIIYFFITNNRKGYVAIITSCR